MSSRRGLFKDLRTDAAEMTVAPGSVIEDFNVIDDIRLGSGQSVTRQAKPICLVASKSVKQGVFWIDIAHAISMLKLK